MPLSARNQFKGKVVSVKNGAVMSEVVTRSGSACPGLPNQRVKARASSGGYSRTASPRFRFREASFSTEWSSVSRTSRPC